ncbi:MAG: CHRD domain-containing protein [Deltaproteobacteria bacterium]|nr:CHRD domain-containing protein [Deltaproteobacteria bacterium]
MRKSCLLSGLLATLFVLAGALAASADSQHNFVADMKGIGGSMASGMSTFELSKDGTALHYKVTVSNIENVQMGHIHLAPEGKDGPVAAWLYPPGPPPMLKEGRFEGTLAEGDIKAENLQGNLKGKPLSALIGKLKAGEAYVNIHTKQMPGGEVRGQIR